MELLRDVDSSMELTPFFLFTDLEGVREELSILVVKESSLMFIMPHDSLILTQLILTDSNTELLLHLSPSETDPFTQLLLLFIDDLRLLLVFLDYFIIDNLTDVDLTWVELLELFWLFHELIDTLDLSVSSFKHLLEDEVVDCQEFSP